MPVTPNLGIEYPDGSGVPSRENWVENPIKSVDTQVAAYVKAHTKSGTTTVPASGSTTRTLTVTFPGGPFASTPRVVANILNGATLPNDWTVRAISVSASGFAVYLRGSAAAPSIDISVSWIATDL